MEIVREENMKKDLIQTEEENKAFLKYVSDKKRAIKRSHKAEIAEYKKCSQKAKDGVKTILLGAGAILLAGLGAINGEDLTNVVMAGGVGTLLYGGIKTAKNFYTTLIDKAVIKEDKRIYELSYDYDEHCDIVVTKNELVREVLGE